MNQTIDHRQFHRLTVFVAIVEQGSMTRAARVLGLSKGVVSGHLRELERELGVRLLERTTRRMAITATGQDVYKAALRMQSAGRDVLAAAEAASGAVAGRVRISGPFDLAATLLAPAVARVRKAHPELRIDIEVGDIALDLVRDEVDIAVRVGVPVDSSYVMRVLGHDVEVLVASPELAEALHVQSPRDLNDVPWIMHAGPFGGSQHFVRPDTGETCDVAWSPMVHASNSTMMRLLAMRGLGFLVIPTYAIVEDLAAGRLVRILAPWERRRLVLQAIMPSRPHPRRRTVMLEALVAEARGIAQVVQAALVPP